MNDTPFLEYLSTEVAHHVDEVMGTGSANFSDGSVWTKAMHDDMVLSKDESVSDYGENSKHEDFADACGNYFANPDSFEKKYPNRTFLLKGIYQ